MRISDWSSDVCSSDLHFHVIGLQDHAALPSPIGMQGQDQILEGKRFACRHRWSPEITALKMTVDCGAPWRSEGAWSRSEEHTSELQSLMRISYAVFCLKKKNSLKLQQ